MNHASVRIYANGDIVTNVVAEKDLEVHIWYNRNMRPGCSLFIDGEIKSEGCVTKECLERQREKVKSIRINLNQSPTIPYR